MTMQEITATELKERIDSGEDIVLIDVREPYEHEEFNIGGELIPLADIAHSGEQIASLGKRDIVLYCRSGNRSNMAQKILAMHHGIQNTFNLKGGIIAWKKEVEGA